MGYVGLPLALLFSAERFRVTGFDIAAERWKPSTPAGPTSSAFRPQPFSKRKKVGFRATTDYSEIAQMDAVIICVPTPLNEHHEPDLSFVRGTVDSIAPMCISTS